VTERRGTLSLTFIRLSSGSRHEAKQRAKWLLAKRGRKTGHSRKTGIHQLMTKH
jgi:hypothetical protein